MAVVLFLLAPAQPLSPTLSLWFLLLVFTIASATQDIAIDGFAIGLLDRHEIGTANRIRVTSHWIALILGGGGIVTLADSFSGGLGTAAFLAFLMSICEKERAATEYALLSALFGFTRSIAGGFSGWGSERLGYPAYFGLTFLLALPAFALLPRVARHLRGIDPRRRET